MSPLKGEARLVVVFNYHRVGGADPGNPFHELHTISEAAFKHQIRLLSRFGPFVSLDQIRGERDLAPLNFCVTFDDVSSSISSVTPFLESRGIPYAVCPCTEITERGYGLPDKARLVERMNPEDEIRARVRRYLGADAIPQDRPFTLMGLIKHPRLDPVKLREAVIDPLFEQVSSSVDFQSFGKPYFDWEDIRAKFLDKELVTIVNHSRGHYQLAGMPRDRLEADIDRSIHDFRKELGFEPEYFTVPYGGVVQDLLVDLTELLRARDYKGVLWISHSCTVVTAPYRAQLIHLPRIHTPTSLRGFLKVVTRSLGRRQGRLVRLIEPAARPGPVEVISSDDRARAVAFENVVNQGKDFTSDPAYYDYMYGDNPFKNGRPDYYAVISDGRIESIMFNMHIEFSLDNEPINGVYSGSWWKLPIANSAASSLLKLKRMRKEAVIGGTKPSMAIRTSMEAYQRVAVTNFVIDPAADPPTPPRIPGAEIIEFDRYDSRLDSLARMVNERFRLTVRRSPLFYRWRFDRYPLAERKYFLLEIEGSPCAYFVTLHSKGVVSVADFYATSVDGFALLLGHLQRQCRAAGIREIHVATTLGEVIDLIGGSWPARRTEYGNYYWLNPRAPAVQHKLDLIEQWQSLEFHETQACGDVLLR